MNLYGYALHSPLTLIDPMGLDTGGGCVDGYEQQHWFPDQFRGRFNSKCGALIAAFNAITGAFSAVSGQWNGQWIDLFTTCVQGRARVRGTQHFQLHDNSRFGYNARVRQILDELDKNNGDCCSLLLKMIELMDNAWTYMWNNTPDATAIPSITCRKYNTKSKSMAKNWTNQLLGQLLDFVCNKKNRSQNRTTTQATPGRTWIGFLGGSAGDATETVLIGGSNVAWGVAGAAALSAVIVGSCGYGSIVIYSSSAGGTAGANAVVVTTVTRGGVQVIQKIYTLAP